MDILDTGLSSIFKNKYSSTIVTIFLVTYASLARPKLPRFLTNLFENPIFRVFLLSLIVYRGNKDPKISILIAMGFVVTMNIISKQKIFDTFTNTDDIPGMDDNVVNTDPDNAGVLDKHGSELDSSYNSDSYNTDSNNQSPDMNDLTDNIEYNDEEMDETLIEEDNYIRPEEENYIRPEEESYIRPEEESYIRPEEERGCVNKSDGTDNCDDDEICDNGKCINAL
jgi:hypothetical protein